MEIHVKDNAINSLEVGLRFYSKFLDKLNDIDISLSHFGNLKFSVISMHNSIELFTKAILLDINEFLVFKTEVETDDVLCKLLRRQYCDKRKKAHIAYHAVFSENSYKTIEYEKCITLLHKIFHDKLSNSNYKTLKDLSEYRNALTHLGYASTYEWYKILIVLNNSLELLLGFYNENLIESSKYFTKKVIKNILVVLCKSKQNIRDIWMASRENILNEVNCKLDAFFDNSLVSINSIEEDKEYGFYEKIKFVYMEKDTKRDVIWEFVYSYFNNSIIIVDTNKFIVGILNLDDKYIKYSHDEEGFPDELKDVYIFVPKEKLCFEEEKVYKLEDKAKYIKVELEQERFCFLVKEYLKR